MPETTTARQFWIRRPGHGEILTADLGPRQEDQVLVRTMYSGISRGTESLVFRGEVPPSQYEAMRAPFQEGEFPSPIKYGYSSVGKVMVGPEHLVDRTVGCLYPHQDYYYVAAADVTLVPDGVPANRAVLAANMETAVNAVWDARPTVGDRIVVVGAGVLGLLVAWICRQIPGAQVTAVDINPARRTVADKLGVAFAVEPPQNAEADLVIHASGQPEGLASALTLAGVEATIVELSWYGNRLVSLPLGEAFHSRRLTVRSSQVARLHPERSPRWTPSRRLALALDLLQESSFDALMTGESPFADLPEVLKRLSREQPTNTLCHRIRF